MATLKTTPMRVLVEDVKPIRLIAELQNKQPADVLHAALSEYFTRHRAEFARLHAETTDFIARGDVEGLARAMSNDAAGAAQKLAARARSKQQRGLVTA